MPGPYLDVYALTTHRDAHTLDRFLDAYVDRATCADLRDFQLMMEPLEATELIPHDAWEWVSVSSLAAIVGWGLSLPHRCFTVYLPASRRDLHGAIVSFTADDQLIVGGSIPDFEIRRARAAEARARKLLGDLLDLVDGHRGVVLSELAPPRTEAAFATADRRPGCLFRIDREPGSEAAEETEGA